MRASPAAGKVPKHASDASVSADSVVLQQLDGAKVTRAVPTGSALDCIACPQLRTVQTSYSRELMLLLSSVACCVQLLTVASTC